MPESHRRSNFFLYTSYALLVIVLLGFSPTFYLRVFYDVPAIPPYVYAHGVAMTAWFVWLCVQTTAVFNGRIALHRKLGMIGMVAFGGFLFLAFLYLQTPDIHKRLMLLASISISLQALGRIAQFSMIDLPEGPFALLGLLMMLVMLGIFDKRSTGRVQRVWSRICRVADVSQIPATRPMRKMGRRKPCRFHGVTILPAGLSGSSE